MEVIKGVIFLFSDVFHVAEKWRMIWGKIQFEIHLDEMLNSHCLCL